MNGASRDLQAGSAIALQNITMFRLGRVTVGSQLAGALWARASTLTYRLKAWISVFPAAASASE